MKTKSKYYYIFCYIFSWSMFVVLLYMCFSYDIWGDEAYSIKKAYLPISRLILVLAENDVHPPLYFVLVHLGYYNKFLETGYLINNEFICHS